MFDFVFLHFTILEAENDKIGILLFWMVRYYINVMYTIKENSKQMKLRKKEKYLIIWQICILCITRVMFSGGRVWVKNILRQVEHVELDGLPGVRLLSGVLVNLDVSVWRDQRRNFTVDIFSISFTNVNVAQVKLSVWIVPFNHLVPDGIRLVVFNRRRKLDGKKWPRIFVISYFCGVDIFRLTGRLHEFLLSIVWLQVSWGSLTSEGICLYNSDRVRDWVISPGHQQQRYAVQPAKSVVRCSVGCWQLCRPVIEKVESVCWTKRKSNHDHHFHNLKKANYFSWGEIGKPLYSLTEFSHHNVICSDMRQIIILILVDSKLTDSPGTGLGFDNL